MRKYQIISADGHLEAPVDFENRVPQKYKSMAPQVVHRPDTDVWVMGEFEKAMGGQLYCGLRYDEFTPETAPFYRDKKGAMRPGTGDSVQRLREQDIDGIDAEVLFYPVAGPLFIRNMLGKDPDCYRALVRAYNDFLADYCSVAPDRLIGVALVPESGVADAITEMERCKSLGLRAASLSNWPNGGLDPKPEEDDRFWAAMLDLDMKMAPHVMFGGPPTKRAIASAMTTEHVLLGGPFVPFMWCGAIARLIMHVFDKFPAMKFYFAETQAGWLPYALNFLDEFYLRWACYLDLPLKKMPSQYYRDHCRFSFIHDPTAMKVQDIGGTDMLMWGSDFPHSAGTYPDSPEILDEVFKGVSAEDRRKVLVENPCAFFGLDPDKELTPTP